VKATRQPLMGDPSAMEYCFKNEKQKQHADPDLNSLLEFFQTAENNVFDSINRFQHLIEDWKGLTARFKEKDEPVHDVKPATVDDTEIEVLRCLVKLFEIDHQILMKRCSESSLK
jgi:hypothetical protein